MEQAADALTRAGLRPTTRAIRERLGVGSLTTINPLLDAWWKKLSSRLDSGPAALQRLPEAVAHAAEALWLQALNEGRRRELQELGVNHRAADEKADALELSKHILTMREEELEGRIQERDRRIGGLELELRESKSRALRAEASVDSLRPQVDALNKRRVSKPRSSKPALRPRKMTAKQKRRNSTKRTRR